MVSFLSRKLSQRVLAHPIYKDFSFICSEAHLCELVARHQFGPNIVTFPDGTKITFALPEANVGGILFGERIIEYLGTIEFRDEKNGLRYKSMPL